MYQIELIHCRFVTGAHGIWLIDSLKEGGVEQHEQQIGPVVAGGLLAVILGAVDLLDWEKELGDLYCQVRHPVEAMTSSLSSTCEQQHVIQRQEGGGNYDNIIWINTTEHDYADRSKDKPWAKAIGGLWCDCGDDNLKRAYKMGVYANGYHFMVYDYYKKEGQMTLFEWDGASHVTYMVASTFNFITKELSYLGYQFRAGDSQWVDAVLGVAIDIGELYVGFGYGIIGIVVGTIFNPCDTLTNLLGMVVLSVESIAVGLWNTVADLLSLITLGWAQVQTAKW